MANRRGRYPTKGNRSEDGHKMATLSRRRPDRTPLPPASAPGGPIGQSLAEQRAVPGVAASPEQDAGAAVATEPVAYRRRRRRDAAADDTDAVAVQVRE